MIIIPKYPYSNANIYNTEQSGSHRSQRLTYLIIKRGVSEVGVVFDLIETLGTPVDGSLGETHQERHQDQAEEAED